MAEQLKGKTHSNTLYPNEATANRVATYSSDHSTPLPKHIDDFHAWVEANYDSSRYMISGAQSQCLVFLARSIGAKRVLEIGVYVGYSSLVWAHAVGAQGSVTGLEASDEYAAKAEAVFKENGVANVEVVRGDALKTLPNLQPEEPYDIVFIDAQKSGYPAYLRTILANSQPGSPRRLLRAGGLIIADNVLRKGLVADDSVDNPASAPGRYAKSEYESDRDLEALREFNDDLRQSDRLESFLMPLYDGVGLARLLD